ncbi:hypothetical protein JA1_000573 [Spathaspora sp. JA1]|nr:hypothetical protein JA1_000573 [Spathaspora sp. JA1]
MIAKRLCLPRFLRTSSKLYTAINTVNTDFPPRQLLVKVEEIPDLPFVEHITLPFKHFKPTAAPPPDYTKTPVLFLHGLFGWKNNYRSVGQSISSKTSHPVYALDLRNHGDAPHVLPHTYSAMAEDVYDFLLDRQWQKVILIGHSMGAKVAMIVSLLYPELVEKLVVIDNTPHHQPLGEQYQRDLLAMCIIESEKIGFKQGTRGRILDKKVINEMLKLYEPDHTVREFLMSNLITSVDQKRRTYHDKEGFRPPVMNFYKHGIIENLGGWPHILPEIKFSKPVLVLKATKSDFVKIPDYLFEFEKYFDDFVVEEIDSGHWITSENPQAFVDVTVKFLVPEQESTN